MGMTNVSWIRRRVPLALRHRGLVLLWVVSLAMGPDSQRAAVIIGWQVYDIFQCVFDLGPIGPAGFVPVPLLALPAGHLADRFPRGERWIEFGRVPCEKATHDAVQVQGDRSRGCTSPRWTSGSDGIAGVARLTSA